MCCLFRGVKRKKSIHSMMGLSRGRSVFKSISFHGDVVVIPTLCKQRPDAGVRKNSSLSNARLGFPTYSCLQHPRDAFLGSFQIKKKNHSSPDQLRHLDSLPQSFQSQTCRKKCSMLTFLLCISTIQGCSIMRHGVALRDGSFSRLRHR